MKRRISKNLFTFVIGMIFTLSIFHLSIMNTVKARTCYVPHNYCEAYEFFPTIQIGKLVKVKEYKIFREYTFTVISTIKGYRTKTSKAISYKEGNCIQGPLLKEGEVYLLYYSGDTRKEKLYPLLDGEFGAKEISQANRDISELKKIATLSYAKRQKCRPWEKLNDLRN